jgi:ribosomal protein L7/L12
MHTDLNVEPTVKDVVGFLIENISHISHINLERLAKEIAAASLIEIPKNMSASKFVAEQIRQNPRLVLNRIEHRIFIAQNVSKIIKEMEADFKIGAIKLIRLFYFLGLDDAKIVAHAVQCVRAKTHSNFKRPLSGAAKEAFEEIMESIDK